MSDEPADLTWRFCAARATGAHSAALIAWSATRDGRFIDGCEVAIHGWRDGRIVAAQFHPENLADDRAFRGEA